jgi:hypothetical protein
MPWPLPPDSRVYRCGLRAIGGTEEALNTLHYVAEGVVGEVDVASAQEVGDKVRDALSAAFRAFLPTSWTFDGVYVSEVVDPGDPSAVGSSAYSSAMAAGTRVGTPNAPLEMCGLISLRTSLAGRSFRGHLFAPPITSVTSDVSNETLQTAYVTLLNNYATALGTNLATGGLIHWSNIEQIVYSRTRAERGLDPFYAKVTARVPSTRVRWLRSRKD